ncbi:MAG: NUDIX domain-containing protein [Rickettsiales bacterium]|jgi:putative (di)nucleoside polyphosphate hydrolase|nr:NUDIX domain-containing protein [Rickettsiales bacterium]
MNFRKAIGVIILDPDNNLVAFQRSDFPETWQCPEGGIDEGETPDRAMARELHEEIGLESKDFEVLEKTKNFIRYGFGEGMKINGYDGQDKQFFLVRLKKPVAEIEFKYDNVAEEIEFLTYRLVRKDELISLLPKFKEELYKKVLTEFKL